MAAATFPASVAGGIGRTARCVGVVLCSLALVSGPAAAEASPPILAFSISAPAAGSITYAGGPQPVVGSVIKVASVVGIGTPAQDGTVVDIVGGSLDFETGIFAELEMPCPACPQFMEFGGGGTITISTGAAGFVDLDDSGDWSSGDIGPNTTLFAGTFLAATPTSVGPTVTVFDPPSTLRVMTAGTEQDYDSDLLDFYGLGGNPAAGWSGGLNVSFQTAAFTPPGAFSSTLVLSGDVVGTPVCGDGIVFFEACDDGNTGNGDGCSAACEVEQGYACSGDNPSLCTTVCGDGLVLGGEACDDGAANGTATSCCTSTCTVRTCAASDQCHEAGICNPATGACSNPSKPDGMPCDDGDLCTQTDLCAGGVCTGTNLSWTSVLSPLDPAGGSEFKVGRAIPVKFMLTGTCSAITGLVARAYLAPVVDGVVGAERPASETSAATAENVFRYDAAGNQYVFNLSTKGLSAGRWRLRIDLGDGVADRVVFFTLR